MRKAPTTVVIFDLGGVVLKGDFMHHIVANAGKRLNVPTAKLHEVMRQEEGPMERGEETEVRFWRRVCERLHVEAPAERVLASLLRHRYAAQSNVDPAVRRLIRMLRQHYTVVALTNTNKTHTAINRSRGLFRPFDRTFISCDLGMRKPEKRVFTHIASVCNVPLAKMLLIDDDRRWVTAARKHGLKAVRFDSADGLEQRLREIGLME